MKKYLIRFCMVTFWVALIFAILYLPSLRWMPYEKNSITVFTWGDILEPSVVAEFERKTGIKVHLNYYSSNEELLVKLKATRGVGYDLIIPSDYAVKILSSENLLKEIDRSKLSFWNHVNPLLLGHFFDPENRYSIPFEWEIFGFGIDKQYFQDKPLEPSWKMIFDPKEISYKIAMINDPIEAVLFAGFYLFGHIEQLNPNQIDQVRNLLIEQKKYVEAYADFRADYFIATKNCPIAIASSSYIWRTMRRFDFVGFVLPKEGTFITVENLSIPLATEKEDLVYQFINFLYQPSSVAAHFETYGFFPATIQSIPNLEMDPQAHALIHSSEEQFKNFHFFRSLVSQQQARDIWVEVKSIPNQW